MIKREATCISGKIVAHSHLVMLVKVYFNPTFQCIALSRRHDWTHNRHMNTLRIKDKKTS